VGCDCDRFLELWNLVFMQFNRDESGTLHPLPKPNIDTGMGLERITSVLQGVGSNFETDLFTPIIHLIEKISGKQYGINRNVDVSMNVIADHGRALAFLISDGMLPSNEGRGYVLRRIVRRAVRHGKLLGIQAPFLSRITERSADMLSTHYRELESARNLVSSVVLVEEKRFAETLDFGMKLLNDEIERLRFKKEKAFSGEIAFKLYDTYGFPLDLTEDIVGEEGFSIDIDGFYQAMEVQKQRSKESWKGIGERPEEIYGLFSSEGIKTNFIGYDTLTAEVTVLKIVKDNQSVDMVREGETCEFVTDITPFYGEAGGQVGDTGMFSDGGLFGEIVDAQRPFEHIVIHKGILTQGTLMCGKTITLTVSGEKRAATAANHTATHLLHATLREILGDHVKQSGSLVSPERLRFDFTHFTSISDDDLLKIERLVNNKIIENREVTTRVMGMKDAVELGAIAIFEEKYGDTVRMIEIPPYSKELCGGTHTKRTGDIGLFKILSEGGIASGVRRIEALTNKEAIEFVQRKLFELRSLESLINASPGEGVSKLKKILDHEKHLEKEIESFKGQLIKDQAQEVLDKIQLIDGIKVLAAQVEVDDQKTLREFADRVKEKLGTGIILLAGIKDEKVLLTSVVTKDLTRKFDASRIVTAAATVVGGGGGGRKDMAQAGGNLPEKTTEALETVFAYVKNHG
ncbi:MAG: alanine--tRNA ligase, partial [Thermodesulfobacteriota bacterium]|nr:alanine--tRNA ligase [Thermodesulfobacteriota bacterium]